MYKSQKDFFAGIMFIVVGMAFAIGARDYPMGDGSRMGPGYFPFVLGVILAILGAVVTFGAIKSGSEDGDKIGRIAWKPLIYVIASNVVFGICIGGLKIGGVTLIPSLGMIVGIYALVFIASRADNLYKFKPTLISATGLAAGCYLVFPVMLKLQMPVWPSFLTN